MKITERQKHLIAVGYALGLDCEQLTKVVDLPEYVIYNWGRSQACVIYQQRFREWQKCLEIVEKGTSNG